MAISVFKNAGSDTNTGINFGKSIISSYRYNELGTGDTKFGAYDGEYFSFNGKGTYTCKKPCNVAIFVVAGAVIGDSEVAADLYKNSDKIAIFGNGGGCKLLVNVQLTIGTELTFRSYVQRTSGSSVLNVYLQN